MRLTTQQLMSLEKYATERAPGECTIQAADLVELCRSYRRHFDDLPEELQALGTMGAAFAGAFAGVVAGRAPPPFLPPRRAKRKLKKSKNESGPSGRGHGH